MCCNKSDAYICIYWPLFEKMCNTQTWPYLCGISENKMLKRKSVKAKKHKYLDETTLANIYMYMKLKRTNLSFTFKMFQPVEMKNRKWMAMGTCICFYIFIMASAIISDCCSDNNNCRTISSSHTIPSNSARNHQ